MKSIISFFAVCLLLSASSLAANDVDLIEVEEILQQRQHDLEDSTPLNEEEKAVLKRMLSEKTIRFSDNDVPRNRQLDRRNLADREYSNDLLANAMLESARAKMKTVRQRAGGELSSRSLQDNPPTRLNGPMEPKEPKKAEGSPETPALMLGPEPINDAPPSKRAHVAPEHEKPERMPEDALQGSDEDSSASITRSLQQNVVQGEGTWVKKGGAQIPEKVSMVLEAFQDSRMIANPIIPGQSYLDPGTQYLYSKEPLYNVVFDVPRDAQSGHPGAYLVNENDEIAVVSGTCIRIDPKIRYRGRAYCQFEYQFLDSHGEVEASITAEGPVTKGDLDTLAITGGSGIFRRTVGTVILESGGIRRGNPPMFIPDDQLDLPSSYLVKMFVFMDSVDLALES